MAPKVTDLKQIFDKKASAGVSAPKEFDFTKINIGNFMLNNDNNESFLKQWLDYTKKRNSFYEEKLEIGKQNLVFIRDNIANLEGKLKKTRDPNEINIFEAQIKDYERDEWNQITTNVHIAFRLL